MALLLSVSILLIYGAYLGFTLLDQTLQERLVFRITGGSRTSKHWSEGETWSTYFQLWGLAITEDVRVGGVTLLASLTCPLTIGLFLYHVYLVWAGMTTNESSKWGDWRDDIADGVIFKAKKSEVYRDYPRNYTMEPKVDWPIDSDQFLVRTEHGHPPSKQNRKQAKAEPREQDGDERDRDGSRWMKVGSLREIDNIYDLGFWDNVLEVLQIH